MKPLCYIASHGAAQPHSFSFAPLTRFVGRFENLWGKAKMEGHSFEEVLLLFLLWKGVVISPPAELKLRWRFVCTPVHALKFTPNQSFK